MDNKLNFNMHVAETIKSCNQILFAMKTMKTFGMPPKHLCNIFKSIVLSKLLYASPAWYGYLSAESIGRLQSFLRKAIKFGYYGENILNIETLQENIELKLFNNIRFNAQHSLHFLLPPEKPPKYDLRPRGHNFTLPEKDNKNFIPRSIFKNR